MKLAARQFVATAPSTRGHLRTHQRVADSRGLATLHGSGGNGGRPQTQKAPRLIQAAADVFAYDNVTTVFTAFNTLLLVPWCMMVFVPNLDFTRSVIRSNIFLYLFCCMFLYLFTAATVEALEAGASLSDEIQFLFLEAVADPKKMASMFSADRPTYAAQDWAHLCTWDYFVGYWIYLQGQDKKVFTRHSLVLAFNSGPPGLISHFITEAITNALRSDSEAAPPAATPPPDEPSSAEPNTKQGASTTSRD